MKLSELDWLKEKANIWSRAVIKVPTQELWVLVYWAVDSHRDKPYDVALYKSAPEDANRKLISMQSWRVASHRKLDALEAQCLLNYYLEGNHGREEDNHAHHAPAA